MQACQAFVRSTADASPVGRICNPAGRELSMLSRMNGPGSAHSLVTHHALSAGLQIRPTQGAPAHSGCGQNSCRAMVKLRLLALGTYACGVRAGWPRLQTPGVLSQLVQSDLWKMGRTSPGDLTCTGTIRGEDREHHQQVLWESRALSLVRERQAEGRTESPAPHLTY